MIYCSSLMLWYASSLTLDEFGVNTNARNGRRDLLRKRVLSSLIAGFGLLPALKSSQWVPPNWGTPDQKAIFWRGPPTRRWSQNHPTPPLHRLGWLLVVVILLKKYFLTYFYQSIQIMHREEMEPYSTAIVEDLLQVSFI